MPEGLNLPEFEDPEVQIVYELLCDTGSVVKFPPEEHWEGATARYIVATLRNRRAESTATPDATLSAALETARNALTDIREAARRDRDQLRGTLGWTSLSAISLTALAALEITKSE